MARKWRSGDPQYGEYQTILFGAEPYISDAEIDSAIEIYWEFGEILVMFGETFYGDGP